MPGIKDQVENAGLGRLARSAGAGGSKNFQPKLEAGFLVGIQTRVGTMYTGTLIRDLMATVERAELRAIQRQMVEEMELQRMFELQEPPMWSRQMFAGAA